MRQIETYCPECGSLMGTEPINADVAEQTTCGNCGEEMPVGDCRVNFAEIEALAS